MKTCTKCKKTKSLDEFWKRPDIVGGGYRPQCKTCLNTKRKEWSDQNPKARKKARAVTKKHYSENKKRYRNNALLKKYSIDLATYDAMYAFQNGKCAICNSNHPSSGQDGLYVDHNHDETKEVRGLLCRKCNSGLGIFGDSIENLKMAIYYLENPPARNIVQ